MSIRRHHIRSFCRKHSGHFEASTDIPRSSLKINGGEKITWFHTPAKIFAEVFALFGLLITAEVKFLNLGPMSFKKPTLETYLMAYLLLLNQNTKKYGFKGQL